MHAHNVDLKRGRQSDDYFSAGNQRDNYGRAENQTSNNGCPSCVETMAIIVYGGESGKRLLGVGLNGRMRRFCPSLSVWIASSSSSSDGHYKQHGDVVCGSVMED